MRIENQSINPENPKQARVFYDLIEATGGHPTQVMHRLAGDRGFKILDAVPQTMFDGWDVWIEFDEEPELPDFFRSVPWRPVGLA